MKPMKLGSSDAITDNENNQGRYLPPFLMGDPQTGWMPRNDTHAYKMEMLTQTTPYQRRSHNSNSRSIFGGGAVDENATTSGVLQPGPPKQGLFDSLENDGFGPTPHRSRILGTHNQNHNQSPSINQGCQINSQPSKAANDQNGSLRALCPPLGVNIFSLPASAASFKPRNADFWVTIFGFPPGDTSAILQQFTVCGTIVNVVQSPQDGNWMHVRFSSRIESDKALNYNQKVIAGNIMVGVTRCLDKSITEKENSNDNTSNSIVPEFSNDPMPSNIGTFAQPSSGNVPQKSSGLVNKAMDLIFRW